MPTDSPIHLDPDKMTITIKVVLAACATMLGVLLPAAVGGAMFYTEVTNAFRTIKETIAKDAVAHEKDREAIVVSIREVRDELRMMQHDAVAVRQAETWIQMFKTANLTKYPELVMPDLPR